MAPRLNIRFVYGICNDVAAMRAFYSDLLGMEELQFMDEEPFGFLVYQSEGFQLMFFRSMHGELPVPEEWSWQPGDGAGDGAALSWSLLVPEEEFRELTGRVKESACPKQTDQPTWRQDSYWGWTVKDPMGNTVELYTVPAERPESTDRY
ncbi:MAG: VOC family protein [Planctomycetota bacterium]|jgi:catechol 2,3-dioxygenase-like lactoylglutathione lyase family enzyme